MAFNSLHAITNFGLRPLPSLPESVCLILQCSRQPWSGTLSKMGTGFPLSLNTHADPMVALGRMSDQEELDEEERLLQEGIRLSLIEQESPDSATKSNAATKRGADKELVRDVVKRPKATPTKRARPNTRMAFPNGAVRITRTPGRSRAKNCINLTDVIHKDSLKSACIFSFFIANEELFEHLPLSRTSNAVPVLHPGH